MNILNTILLTLLTTTCLAQKEHNMSDNTSIYWHEYEQELLSKLLSKEVEKVETFEKNYNYYNSDLEYKKSIRYFDSKGRDSLTIFKAIDGSILNQLRFKHLKNKILEIIVNHEEYSIDFEYWDNKISYSNGRDSTKIELDSQNKILNETSNEIETKFIYNEIDKTKKSIFPSEYNNFNQICYYTFENELITNIKTITLENNEVESDITIEYKFDKEGLIKEIISLDTISNKSTRNIVHYR
jgi:hypothetical protein